jgi:hypothetical protein
MLKWEKCYFDSFLKNLILKVLYKEYGDTFSQLCVLDTTVEDVWLDFYLETLKTDVVTSISDFLPQPIKYNKYNNYDFVESTLYETIGPFTSQYDIVNTLDTLSLELDDFVWQKSLENLCNYLKPQGVMIISGNLQKTYTDDTFRSRSEGLWRAIITSCSCSVKHFIKDPCKDLLKNPCDILIIGKK